MQGRHGQLNPRRPMLFETALIVDAAMNLAMALAHPEPSRASAPGASDPSRLASSMLSDWDGVLPVDVHGMCARLGIPVQAVAMADAGVAAALSWNEGHTNAAVSLNEGLPTNVQRFALAQALGAILARAPGLVEVGAGLPGAADGHGQRANAFALHLLIPARGLDKMAERFRTEEALAEV